MTWTTAAACRELDTNEFFPPTDQPGIPPIAAAACAACPVADTCLRHGIAHNTHGVWGGVRLDDTIAAPPGQPLPPHTALIPILTTLHRAQGTRRYSAPEIAAMLGIEPQTARANLHTLTRHQLVERTPQNNPRPDLYHLADDIDIVDAIHLAATWTRATNTTERQLQIAVAAMPAVHRDRRTYHRRSRRPAPEQLAFDEELMSA